MNRVSLLCIGLLMFTPRVALADSIIASTALDLQGNALNAPTASGIFTWVMRSDGGLFGQHPITAAAIGTTIVADATTEPGFSTFASRLTNGRPDFSEVLFEGGGFGAVKEADVFHLPSGIVDFRGFAISSIVLRVDDFSARPFDLNPAFTRVRLQGALSVLGTGEFEPVPEPASMTLFATGVLGIGRLCWRRRRAIS